MLMQHPPPQQKNKKKNTHKKTPVFISTLSGYRAVSGTCNGIQDQLRVLSLNSSQIYH